MRVVETLMSNADRWSLTFRPDVPKTVLQPMIDAHNDYAGYVCVFDGPTDFPSLDTAMWTGRLDGRSGALGFEGGSLATLMQSPEGHGQHMDAVQGTSSDPNYYKSRTFAEWIAALFDYPETGNGGIYYTPADLDVGGTPSWEGWWPLGLGMVEMLNWIVTTVNNDTMWRLEPDGKLNIGDRRVGTEGDDPIFRSDPTVVIMGNPPPVVTSGQPRAVRGYIDGLRESSRFRAETTIAAGSGEGLAIPVATVSGTGAIIGIDGEEIDIYRVVDASNTETSAELTEVATSVQDDFADLERNYRLKAVQPCRGFVRPGDTVYAYDDRLQITGTDTVTVGTSYLDAVKVLVTQMRWNVRPGQSVWLLRPSTSGGQDWYDLTVHLDLPGSADTMLEVTTSTYKPAATQMFGPEKYGITPRPPRVVLPGDTIQIGTGAGVSPEVVIGPDTSDEWVAPTIVRDPDGTIDRTGSVPAERTGSSVVGGGGVIL
jgi:hypothetical protein